MGFESRHRNDEPAREDLAEVLARAHQLELERSRELLRRARQAAAEDLQARSVRQWFAMLVDDAGGDAVGKRTVREEPEAARAARPRDPAKPAPGRETLVMREARFEEEQARAPGRDEPRQPAQRLDLLTQWRMGKTLGFDFSGVSIRPDSPEATGSTRAIVKDGEIHFREGAYRPGTPDGDWLIAHELAHVVQQRGGRGERAGSRRELEREADRAASLAMAGRPASIALRAQPAAAYAFDEGEPHHGGPTEAADAGAGEARGAAAAPAAVDPWLVGSRAAESRRLRGAAARSGRAAGGLDRTTPVAAAMPAADAGAGGAPAGLREQLLEAAASGRGAAAALAAADPAAAAATLRELRGEPVPGQAAPALQLVARADGGAAARLIGRGSAGAPLTDDVAARLGPHVGDEVAAAARVHTDEAADLVAAAHHARAVALGDDVFFAHGEYAPGTERGDELLAHELTHLAQARRGELARAAAKGIESGTNLDPSEAQADLQAKLAVIQLHAPDAAPPALAAPSGQPTTPGARAAKLAAQQQRLSTAGKPALPGGAAPVPPTSRPQAPVAHPPPPMAAAPAPAHAGGNPYVDAFEAPPSKQATELWTHAGEQATTKTAADQARFDAALQPLPVHLDGNPAPAGKGGGVAAPGGRAGSTTPVQGARPPAATSTPTPAAPKVTAAATAAKAVKPVADKAQMKAVAQRTMAALPTTSPAVKTDPGPAPVTDLAGQSDPVRALGDHQHAVAEGAKALEAQKKQVLAGPGAAQVQPAKLDEKLAVPKAPAVGPMPALPTVEGMAKLKKWGLPADAQAAFDDVAKPKLDASLAEAKAKMAQAEAKRDADRAKAVDDAHEKVKKAHADADKQQQAKVAESRTQIANRQAETLVKQETEIKKLDQQASAKKQGTLGKISARIQGDQARVEGDYQGAQQKADEQKRKGEADAARKKKEAQEKAERNKSWFDQAADTISSGIQAVADEIDHALEEVGKAIGQILDAVKTAACQVIDAARDFVCQALTELGDWLKSAVTALLGSVFPELAAALNQMIDAAVSAAKAAVTAIADRLKQAVTALCDGLKASLASVLAAFKAAVQAAATFAKAVVTGDWKLVGKMVLDGILKALGIDPAAFYALIGKAEDSIEKIIENPGAFVGHLIDAVKLGFKQFGANFWTHLKDGLVQWLFGTFAEAGIRMPASFDIAGIFDLVAQILGLTWPRMRGKVVKVIGEKNTERLEFVWKYIEALITGGFSGLWEKIQQDMSGLWDMVVGGIKSWLIEKVVQQAIIKIATMWNPVGAIIQLIQTAWNVYQWVKENAQRIFGLVQAVVDSISNIVAGNIGGAANFIEASLAKLVPMAISLFADLLGLGGIADKIRGIIEKVQTMVDQAIDKLISRVMGMFKGKGDKKDDSKDGDTTADPEVPKSLVESPALVDKVSPSLGDEIAKLPAGAKVIYQAPETDPKTVTKNLLAEHKDASFDKTSATLKLPPVHPDQLGSAGGLGQLGQLAAQQTGVSKVTLQTDGKGGAKLIGSINPETQLANLGADEPLEEVKVEFNMAGEQHHLRFKVTGEQITLEMASSQFEILISRIGEAGKQVRVNIAAAERENDTAEADKWRGCQQELLAVGRVAVDAESYAKGRKVTKASEQELYEKLHEVGVQLTAIGTKYGITSLELTGNQGTAFTPSERQAVLSANKAAHGGKYQCEHCGFRNSNEIYDPSAPVPSGQFQVDHVIPHSKGGLGVAGNGRVLDATCNASRGNRDTIKTTGMDKDRQRGTPLHDK
jgi:hypothetical protein